ncbi:ankyrin repeat-containing protein [Planoprotostelium fungivorum]|uniref:Ankyrin repeat-containing protein n=1 Tax=Planoprotostelium fungivorum TaxID=1890364 RepID=A0A2P6NCH3_9EUKA|nr:ankyrin repeat-containing protein [Planoprotostelium fungivorum]
MESHTTILFQFFEAARTNNPKRVQRLLDSGISVNARDDCNGSTALHFACLKGARQVIEVLVKNGADVNVRNDRGVTPLYYLAQSRYEVMAIYLIHQGARLDIADVQSFSVLDVTPQFMQQELIEAADIYQKSCRNAMRRTYNSSRNMVAGA